MADLLREWLHETAAIDSSSSSSFEHVSYGVGVVAWWRWWSKQIAPGSGERSACPCCMHFSAHRPPHPPLHRTLHLATFLAASSQRSACSPILPISFPRASQTPSSSTTHGCSQRFSGWASSTTHALHSRSCARSLE